jgi:hypothetical protein
MRETNAIIILRRKAARLQKETGRSNLVGKGDTKESTRGALQRAIVRPIKLLIFSPIVTLLSVYSSLAFGFIYLLFTTFPDVFENQYGFSVELSGLSYLGVGIGRFIAHILAIGGISLSHISGMIVSLFVFGALNDKGYNKLMLKNGGNGTPEMRLPCKYIECMLSRCLPLKPTITHIQYIYMNTYD